MRACLLPVAALIALTPLAGCGKPPTVEAQRLDCLNDAANAPTTAGVAQKRQVCLLRFPLEPGKNLDGSTDWSVFTPVEPEKTKAP